MLATTTRSPCAPPRARRARRERRGKISAITQLPPRSSSSRRTSSPTAILSNPSTLSRPRSVAGCCAPSAVRTVQTPPVPLFTTPRRSLGASVIASASAIMLRAFIAHDIPPGSRRWRGGGHEQVELPLDLVQRERANGLRGFLGRGAPGEKGRLDVSGDLRLLAAPAHEEQVAA